jgi:hypothetical protein
MTTAIIQNAEPFSPEQTAEYKARFNREGFLHIPDVLTAEEVEALKAAIDRVFDDPNAAADDRLYGSFVAVRLFECDPIFEDMLTREPIISLVESILEPNCHLIAQNVVRNEPGQAIDEFHVDDTLIFPIGEGMERHDPDSELPVFIVTVQIPLTDIPSEEYGPTQFVPGSHYSGRQPNDTANPSFEGVGPQSIFCKAGDIYLQNGQCWHRGVPNNSDRTRYLLQLAYGKRLVAQRFYPFVNYSFPPGVLERADERRKRVLGFHPSGAYG